MRTPLGLIPEGNDPFTLFYTAYGRKSKTYPDLGHPRYGNVGLVTVKLKRP